MSEQQLRYLLEYRYLGQIGWIQGSSFKHLKDAKQCVDATLTNCQQVVEGRVFDWKLMAYRYYRSAYPFKP